MAKANEPLELTCDGSETGHPHKEPRVIVASAYIETLSFVQDPMIGGDLNTKPPSRGSSLFEAQMYTTPEGVWALTDAGGICTACLAAHTGDFRVATPEDIAIVDAYDAEEDADRAKRGIIS